MIVWLASYPRSGNTLIRIILNKLFNVNTYSLYGDEYDIGADKGTAEVVGQKLLPADFDIDKARVSEEKFFIKTHDAPVNNEDKAIYIVRDGRESTLSYFNYKNSYFKSSDSLMAIIYGDTLYGIWSDHIKSWNPRERQNTLLLKYEDLTTELSECTKNISSFLDVTPEKNEMPSFDELHKINPRFFKSGKTNSWKELYTHEEHNAFWLKNYDQMLEFGYTEDIPKLFSNNSDIVSLVSLLSRENSYVQQNIIFDKERIIEEKNKQIAELNKQIAELNKQAVLNTNWAYSH